MNLPINRATSRPTLTREVTSLKALKDCLKGAELMGLSLTNTHLHGTFPDYETPKQIEDRGILNDWLTDRGESLCEAPESILSGLHYRAESLVLKANYLLLTYTNGDKAKLLIGSESIVTLEFN